MRSELRGLANKSKEVNRHPPKWLSYTVGIVVALVAFIAVKVMLGAFPY